MFQTDDDIPYFKKHSAGIPSKSSISDITTPLDFKQRHSFNKKESRPFNTENLPFGLPFSSLNNQCPNAQNMSLFSFESEFDKSTNNTSIMNYKNMSILSNQSFNTVYQPNNKLNPKYKFMHKNTQEIKKPKTKIKYRPTSKSVQINQNEYNEKLAPILSGIKEKEIINNDNNNNIHTLDDFKSFLNTRMLDINHYICTQKGSKEVERYLKKCDKKCIDLLLDKIKHNLVSIMTDIYGNYFIQKIFKLSDKEQIKLITLSIQSDYVKIAKDPSGTYVLQKLLDTVTTKEEEELTIKMIENKEKEMAYDDNATHVFQKIILKVKEENRENINKFILNDLNKLSLNSKGICIVKKFIETNSSIEIKNRIKQILIDNCIEISQNPYGNYFTQYVLEKWKKEECNEIITIIVNNCNSLSRQKYSSNVVDRISEIVGDDIKDIMIKEFFSSSNNTINYLKNKYAKFVLLRFVKNLNKTQKQNVFAFCRSLLNTNLDKNSKKNLTQLINQIFI